MDTRNTFHDPKYVTFGMLKNLFILMSISRKTSKVLVGEASIFINMLEPMLMAAEDYFLVKAMGEIMELNIYMEYYENMIRCVFDVSKQVLDENKKISVDITGLDS